MFDSVVRNVVDEVLIWEEPEDISEIVNTFKSMGIVVHVSSKNNDFLPDEKIDYINGILQVYALWFRALLETLVPVTANFL